MANVASSLTYSNTPLTGNVAIDSLVWGQQWATTPGQALNISYSFPLASGPSTWSANYPNAEPATASALNAGQQAAVRGALQAWANVANIAFTEVADTTATSGDFRFAFSKLPPGNAAWAYLPTSAAFGGDVWIADASKGQPGWGPGTFNYFVLLHEIGHALGLGHPHDGQVRMPAALDSIRTTVMSYTWPGDLLRVDPKGGWSLVTAPMLYDIAAIQHLYGANMSYRAGDDVYSFASASAFCTAVWDAGGTDTFDFTGLRTSLSMTLAAGSTCMVPTTGGRQATLSIAFNVTIENLIGGAAADVLTGNDAGNHITGAGGDDVLTGGGGDDTLTGGDGSDTGRYALVRSAYTVSDNGDGSWSVTATVGAEGRDVLRGVEWLEFSDSRMALGGPTQAPVAPSPGVISGTTGADRLTGGELADTIQGLAGNDTISVGAGDDILIGGGGADRLTGGAGYDTARYDAAVSVNLIRASLSTGEAHGDTFSGIEAFEFGGGADSFVGGKAGDTALGGAGNDTLSGGAGNDTLTGGEGDDLLAGGAGRDLLTGGGGADRFVFAAMGDLGDTIADYDAGDVLQFAARAFGKTSALTAGQTLIVNESPACVAKAATFLFDTDTGVLSYDRDGSGKAGAVVVATLTGVTTLDISDFVFV